MGPRTAYRNGSLMLFSNGDPGRQDSVALSEDGVVLRLGEERSLLRWAELARMDVQPSGVRRARSGRVQRWIEQATLLLLRLAAALLFALTFGGLGGSGIWGAGSIRITPVLRGKPEAFSLTYSIPIRWPPDTTALEVEWFGAVTAAATGRDVRLNIDRLSELLDNSIGISEFSRGIWQAVLR